MRGSLISIDRSIQWYILGYAFILLGRLLVKFLTPPYIMYAHAQLPYGREVDANTASESTNAIRHMCIGEQ